MHQPAGPARGTTNHLPTPLCRYCNESGFSPAATVREAHMAHLRFYCDPTSNACCPSSGITPAAGGCAARPGCASGDECTVRQDPCYEDFLKTGQCLLEHCVMAPSYTVRGLYAARISAWGQAQVCINPSLWQLCADLTMIGEMVCNSPQLNGHCTWRKVCSPEQAPDVVLKPASAASRATGIRAAGTTAANAAEASASPSPSLCNEPDGCCMAAFVQGQFSEAACLAAPGTVGDVGLL